jgi:hypothetical protein
MAGDIVFRVHILDVSSDSRHPPTTWRINLMRGRWRWMAGVSCVTVHHASTSTSDSIDLRETRERSSYTDVCLVHPHTDARGSKKTM